MPEQIKPNANRKMKLIKLRETEFSAHSRLGKIFRMELHIIIIIVSSALIMCIKIDEFPSDI